MQKHGGLKIGSRVCDPIMYLKHYAQKNNCPRSQDTIRSNQTSLRTLFDLSSSFANANVLLHSDTCNALHSNIVQTYVDPLISYAATGLRYTCRKLCSKLIPSSGSIQKQSDNSFRDDCFEAICCYWSSYHMTCRTIEWEIADNEIGTVGFHDFKWNACQDWHVGEVSCCKRRKLPKGKMYKLSSFVHWSETQLRSKCRRFGCFALPLGKPSGLNL